MSNEKRLTATKTALAVAVLTVVSKLIGFARELVLANYYGAGSITDAYVMAQSIPNTLLAAVLSAASTAFMPTFSKKYEKDGQEAANRFTSQLLNSLWILVAAATVLGNIFASQLVGLFAPGYSAETAAITAYYLRIAFFMLFATSALNLFDAYLQYKGEFIGETIIGFIQSSCIIAFIIISARTSYKALIWGPVCGYVLRCGLEFLLTKKHGFKYSFDLHVSDSVKEVMVLALPILISGSFSEINTFVDRMLASNLPEGSVSALNYGNFIVTTILAFTVTIPINIIYPRLNQAFAQNDSGRISELSEDGINLMSIITVPCTFGAMLYARQIIQVIYERGSFGELATAMTGTALLFYAIRMIYNPIGTMVGKVFYSMHDTKTPMYCGFVSIFLNISLNIILVRVMGLGGLALATSVAGAVGTALQCAVFRRKYPEITLIGSWGKLLKICIFSVISVGVSYGVYLSLGALFGSNGWLLPRMVQLGTAVLAAVAAYLGLLYAAKFEELNLIRDLFKKN